MSKGIHILVVSPIPSHPTNQGNAARIFTVCRLLQSAGLTVHFLYYTMEGLSPAQKREMESYWDYLHVVPCRPRDNSPTGDGCYQLDDWYEAEVSAVARNLHRRWDYRAVIANYVWFSAVLQAFDRDTLKILDTHDVFGDRHKRFIEAGMEPAWFYTTPQEEARGLARADIVMAIQGEEAETFKALGHEDVRVVGHLLPQRRRRFGARAGKTVSVGYLASGNPLNVSSFEAMLKGMGRKKPAPNLRFVVAGSICGKLKGAIEPFASIGMIGHLDEFYDSVDVVVNPMTMGTGLKIKSVEAIFQGLPLLASKAAMVGLPVFHALHEFEGPDDIGKCLSGFDPDHAQLNQLADASYKAAEVYATEVRRSIKGLVQSIKDHSAQN
jgi:hypothetical protein